MHALLLNPPVAFFLYVLLVGVIYLFGRALAPSAEMASSMKRSTFSSGEAPPGRLAAPGYRPYFVVALFFAILHLGVLVLGSSSMSVIALLYLVGLMVALLALVLG